VLFHVSIGHEAQDCPGRRPTEPPGLIAPSDTRAALETQLGVKLHFVFWSAACMLWAQPEHVAFAILEADNVESALQYLGATVPENWTSHVLPVWNLPSQLRLVRQVQLAPTMVRGGTLSGTEPNARTATQPIADTESTSVPPVTEPAAANDAPGAQETWPQTGTDPNEPGTITRLLHDLDVPSVEAEHPPPGDERQGSSATHPPAEQATQIEQFTPPPVPRVRAWLVATNGPTRGRTFPIPIQGATIGRLPENSIYIPDERLSREHARIEFRDGSFFLNDLGSRNGTALNGSLVSDPRALSSGDTVELGSNTFIVTIEANPPATGG
jgi:predicted component of type VI protein secretion system